MTIPFDPEPFVQRQLDAYNARNLDRFGLGDDPVDVAAIYEVTPQGIATVWFVGGPPSRRRRRSVRVAAA
jgi:hypothetical protein